MKRVLVGHVLKCSDDMPSDEKAHCIDIADAMRSAIKYRVYKSVFHFKVLAKEKKNQTKVGASIEGRDDYPLIRSRCFASLQPFVDSRAEEKSGEIFPVTYEAMMPLFSNTSARNARCHNYFLQSGKYQVGFRWFLCRLGFRLNMQYVPVVVW